MYTSEALDRVTEAMSPEDVALHLEVAAVVAVAVLIVAVAVAATGDCWCDDEGVGAARDVERALGDDTLVAYAQAAAAAPRAPREQQRCCVFCQSEYAKADELVRVVPACGHFFHAECDVDRWIRKRRTCPLCRGALWPPPLPECPPMPRRANGAWAAVV